MKKIVLILLLSCVTSYSQETSYPVELYFGTDSASGEAITFTLTAQGQVWSVEFPFPPGCDMDFFKTDEYDIVEYTVSNHNQPVGSWAGLDFASSRGNNGQYPIFGYGLYKVTNSNSESYFYIDYRDQNAGCVPPYGTIGHHLDLWIKYNASNNTLYYSNDGQVNGTFNQSQMAN